MRPAPEPGAAKEKRPREKKPKVKNDPKLVAAARELRDRYLERVNEAHYLPAARGKYEVSRATFDAAEHRSMPLLGAA